MRLSFPVYKSVASLGIVRELPTTAFYLLNPLSMALPDLAGRLVYCGANIFKIDSTYIIVRTTTTKGLDWLSSARGSIIYIVDDDFASAALDISLPAYYRKRLDRFLAECHDKVTDLATDFVTPNQALGDVYRRLSPGKPVHVIDPVYSGGPPRFRQSQGTVRIGLLLSRSHQADLSSLSPALTSVLREYDNVRIVHRLRDVPFDLPDDPRIEKKKALPWRQYRNWNPEIHIGLYPLLDTDFNRCRSINKLIEYIHHGAAPLIADVPAMKEVPSILRVRSTDWHDRIGALIANPNLRRSHWETAVDFVDSRDPLGRAVELWSDLLRPSCPSLS